MKTHDRTENSNAIQKDFQWMILNNILRIIQKVNFCDCKGNI